MTSTMEWRAEGAFFEYRDHRIFWREGGDPGAPTLLLMHGYPTASWDWHKLWPALTERYHVIALDMIGFGFSDKPYFYDYRLMDQADVYDTFLQLRSVTPYHWSSRSGSTQITVSALNLKAMVNPRASL